MDTPRLRRRPDGLIEIVPTRTPLAWSVDPSPLSFTAFLLAWALFLGGLLPMDLWYVATGAAVLFELWRGRTFFLGEWPPSQPSERRAMVMHLGQRSA